MDDHIKVDVEGDLYFDGQKLTHDKIIEFFKKLDFERINDKDYQLKWQNNNVTQRINIVPEDTLFVVKDVVVTIGCKQFSRRHVRVFLTKVMPFSFFLDKGKR